MYRSSVTNPDGTITHYIAQDDNGDGNYRAYAQLQHPDQGSGFWENLLPSIVQATIAYYTGNVLGAVTGAGATGTAVGDTAGYTAPDYSLAAGMPEGIGLGAPGTVAAPGVSIPAGAALGDGASFVNTGGTILGAGPADYSLGGGSTPGLGGPGEVPAPGVKIPPGASIGDPNSFVNTGNFFDPATGGIGLPGGSNLINLPQAPQAPAGGGNAPTPLQGALGANTGVEGSLNNGNYLGGNRGVAGTLLGGGQGNSLDALLSFNRQTLLG
jgi:hypothetical protein